MNVSQKEYSQMSKDASSKSKSYKNIPLAFIFGGFICSIGQVLFEIYTSLGMKDTNAATLVSITLIFISALLTGLKLYEKIAKYAGAGTLVPITGFANSVVSPAIEFRSEGFILGVGAKIFIISGPVILYGTVASVIYGLIYYIIQK